MSDLIAKTAEVTANWWAERWEPESTREAFRAAIQRAVDRELRNAGEVFLHVDYDPDGVLLEVIRGIGVECSGNLFSAKGLLPYKHATKVRPGLIEPKEGYGNWPAPIVVEAEP